MARKTLKRMPPSSSSPPISTTNTARAIRRDEHTTINNDSSSLQSSSTRGPSFSAPHPNGYRPKRPRLSSSSSINSNGSNSRINTMMNRANENMSNISNKNNASSHVNPGNDNINNNNISTASHHLPPSSALHRSLFSSLYPSSSPLFYRQPTHSPHLFPSNNNNKHMTDSNIPSSSSSYHSYPPPTPANHRPSFLPFPSSQPAPNTAAPGTALTAALRAAGWDDADIHRAVAAHVQATTSALVQHHHPGAVPIARMGASSEAAAAAAAVVAKSRFLLSSTSSSWPGGASDRPRTTATAMSREGIRPQAVVSMDHSDRMSNNDRPKEDKEARNVLSSGSDGGVSSLVSSLVKRQMIVPPSLPPIRVPTIQNTLTKTSKSSKGKMEDDNDYSSVHSSSSQRSATAAGNINDQDNDDTSSSSHLHRRQLPPNKRFKMTVSDHSSSNNGPQQPSPPPPGAHNTASSRPQSATRAIASGTGTAISEEKKSENSKDDIQWVCEVCETAVFDTFEDAQAHEAKCRASSSSSKPDQPPATTTTKPHQPTPSTLPSSHDNPRGSLSSSNPTTLVTPEDSTDSANSNQSQSSPSPTSSVREWQWVCEYCETAVFDTFEEAQAHEAQCRSKGASTQQQQQQQPRCVLSPVQSGTVVPQQVPLQQVPQPSQQVAHLQWVCEVCETAVFDCFEDACAHESQCRLIHQGQSALPPPPISNNNNHIQNNNDDNDEEDDEDDIDESLQWVCAVCETAVFDSYPEAVAHERSCQGKRPIGHHQIITEGISSLSSSSLAPRQPSPNTIRRLTTTTGQSQSGSSANNDTTSQFVTRGTLQWACAKCESAVFDTYKEACDHEMTCPVLQQERQRRKNKNTDSNNKTATSTGQSEMNDEDDKDKDRAVGTLQWACAHCGTAVFDKFEDACRHEETCDKAPTNAAAGNSRDGLEGGGRDREDDNEIDYSKCITDKGHRLKDTTNELSDEKNQQRSSPVMTNNDFDNNANGDNQTSTSLQKGLMLGLVKVPQFKKNNTSPPPPSAKSYSVPSVSSFPTQQVNDDIEDKMMNGMESKAPMKKRKRRKEDNTFNHDAEEKSNNNSNNNPSSPSSSSSSSQMVTHWMCSYCPEVFESYDAACEHESTCEDNKNKTVAKETKASDNHKIGDNKGNANHNDSNSGSHNKGATKSTSLPETNNKNSRSPSEMMATNTKTSLSLLPPPHSKTKWICEYCETALFDSYDEASAHEEECKRLMMTTARNKKNNKQQ